MRPAQISRLLAKEFESVGAGQHTPVMLWGPPGVGKSQMVAQVADNHAVPLIDLRLSQLEPSDLRGIPFRVGEGVEWAVPNQLPDARRHGPRGILFLDEITSALPSVAAAAYQLILDRRLGEYRVPEGWAIFAAGNRLQDRGVTYAMPAPLANRFSHYEVEVHIDDWLAWAVRSGIDSRLQAFLRQRPDLLFDFHPETEQHAFPTPRAWAFADRALRKFTSDAALLQPALSGCVGEAAAAAFKRFLDDGMPDVEKLLADPQAVIPADVGQQLFLAEALRARVQAAEDETVLTRVLELARAFPDQGIALNLVLELRQDLGPSLYANPAFSPWATAIADQLSDVSALDESRE